MIKLKNIEFLKFLFAIEILYFHLVHPMLHNVFRGIPEYGLLNVNASDGQKSVDFMFIIAGFLLSYSYKDIDYWSFIKKKICRLWPITFISLGLYLIFNYNWFSFYDNVFSLLFINNIGITLKSGNNGTLWFLSVFFWVSLLYFYLLKNCSTQKLTFISIWIIWFSYSFLIHAKNGNINDQIYSFNNVFNVGLLRGLGGMAIGYVCSVLYKNVTSQQPSKLSLCLYSVLEISLLTFIIYNISFNNLKFYNDMIFIIAFVFLFWIFINHKGYLSILLENKFSEQLGKISLSIFIMNLPIYDFFKHTYWKYCSQFIFENPIINIFICIGIAFAVAVIIHHIAEKPLQSFLRNKLFAVSKPIKEETK